MNTVTLPLATAERVLNALRTVGTNLNEIEAHLTPDETQRSRLLSGEFTGELFGLATTVEAAICEVEQTQ